MKTKSTGMALCIFVCIVINISALANPDSTKSLPEFRNVEWGSLLNDVKGKEMADYLQSFSGFGIEALSFKGKIAGLDVRIDYTFENEKFTEGSYSTISNDTFENDFQKLLRYLEQRCGKPNYTSGPLYTSDSVWIKISNTGLYRGPSLYWEFNNGFISLYSEKFKEEITLTILFVHEKTIDQYDSENRIELKDYNTKSIKKQDNER